MKFLQQYSTYIDERGLLAKRRTKQVKKEREREFQRGEYKLISLLFNYFYPLKLDFTRGEDRE